MDIQSMVGKVINSKTALMGGEDVTIDGITRKMILNETTEEDDVYGGTRYIRRMTAVQDGTLDWSHVQASSLASARGKNWRISDVEQGAAMITLNLEEANKVKNA